MEASLTFTLCFICSISFSQPLAKEYLDEHGKITSEDSSYYFDIGKVEFLNNGEPHFIDTVQSFYTSNNELKGTRVYDKNGVLQGIFREFYPNGKPKQQGNYRDNRIVGLNYYWYETGKFHQVREYSDREREISIFPDFDYRIVDYWTPLGLRIINKGNGTCHCNFNLQNKTDLIEKGKIVNGLRDSIWHGYANDTLLFTEHYAKGKFVSGERHIEGKTIAYGALEEPPSFVGGVSALINFLRKEMHYPPEARQMGIEGRVSVSFYVDQYGNIRDIILFKGVHLSIDNEAIRVIKIMPKWNPGSMRGIPISVKNVIPINFTLE